MRQVTATLVAAALMSIAVTPPALAGAAFNARPTQPMACPAGASSGKLWQGTFHGRKELDLGWQKYQDTAERYCFASEKQCRNWLYNMQSEYTVMVWSAVCKKGVGQ